jgi:MoaA/NifB/PqqE/SkfB family radical SAM enzyme
MTTGMTTKEFLLTEERLRELFDAGMVRIQISVDALKPKPGIPKSLKTLRKKIELVARHPIWFRVNTVICDDTIDEVEEVAKACWDLGVAINFSVVHDRGRLTKRSERFLDRVRWLKEHKQQGRPISTPFYLIDYYERALEGQPMDWTCQAGSKCFYVSAEGHFQLCYHVPSTQLLMDVTRDDLARNRGKKGCETDCGVDCVVHTSLPFSNRMDLIKLEVKRRLLPVLR